jgi:hypothetical protein
MDRKTSHDVSLSFELTVGKPRHTELSTVRLWLEKIMVGFLINAKHIQ